MATGGRLNPMELKRQQRKRKATVQPSTGEQQPTHLLQSHKNKVPNLRTAGSPSLSTDDSKEDALISKSLDELVDYRVEQTRVTAPESEIQQETDRGGHAMDHIPKDFSTKTTINFYSEKPFSWCSEASAADECSGIVKCTGMVDMSKDHEQQSVLREQWQQALQVWFHPAVSVPRLALKQLVETTDPKDDSIVAFYRDRQREWREAFRSLYHMFRQKHIDVFYVMCQNNAIVFAKVNKNADSGNNSNGNTNKNSKTSSSRRSSYSNSSSSHLFALVSQGSKGLRKALHSSSINFTVILPSADADSDRVATDNHTKFTAKNYQNTLRDDRSAVLSFSGHMSVQGLYEYMLNHNGLASAASTAAKQGLPKLVARSPFLYASVQRLTVDVRGLIWRPGNSSTKSQRRVYNLQVSGFILPDAACSLCQLVKRFCEDCENPAYCDAVLVDQDNTVGFNSAVCSLLSIGQGSRRPNGECKYENICNIRFPGKSSAFVVTFN